jgi:hypothetical protein
VADRRDRAGRRFCEASGEIVERVVTEPRPSLGRRDEIAKQDRDGLGLDHRRGLVLVLYRGNAHGSES